MNVGRHESPGHIWQSAGCFNQLRITPCRSTCVATEHGGELFRTVGELPLFNPDLEAQMPLAVCAFHAEVAAAAALMIASPEYAHGVTGTIKNALDWLVSFEPFIYKPVAVLNASPRAHRADEALRETLRTMSAIIVEEASTCIPLLGAHLTENGMVELILQPVPRF